jgi:modulator of FtsH protease HflC
MNRVLATAVAVVIAAGLFRLCAFIVDQKHYAIVFELGQIKRVISEPGLHFKAPPPFQNVEYLDRRVLTIDSQGEDRVQTSENKNLLIDTFVKWRISEPFKFWVSFHGVEREANDRISTLVRDAMNQAVNKRTVNGITSRERDKAMEEIRASVQDRVKDLGVTIVDVRLKRVDFLGDTLDAVFKRMDSERKRVANQQRSTGAADAEKIRADADKQKEVLLAEAYRDAQRIKGEGDARASAIYAQAYGANPEFYAFYRSLDAYRQSFRSRSDMLMVDPSSDFFKYMKSPGGAAAGH